VPVTSFKDHSYCRPKFYDYDLRLARTKNLQLLFSNKQTNAPLSAFFPGQSGKPAPEGVKIILDFSETDDGVAVASADGPYANHLHLDSDR